MPVGAQALERDQNLLKRFIRERDEEAFACIVWQYADMVYATCQRILQNSDCAQEATQETFLRSARQPGSVKLSLGGWLHRTAARIAIDIVRQDASRRDREAAYAAMRSLESSSWQELSPVIDEALTELSEEDRELLVGHFLMGKSQRELTAQAEVSPATLSRRMQAALESLRTKLRKKGVIVGLVAVATWLTNSPAEAVPPNLKWELGKIVLVSGSVPVATIGIWSAIKAQAFFALALATLAAALFWLGMAVPDISSKLAGVRPSQPQRQAQSQPQATPEHPARVIRLPPGKQELNSQHIDAIENPRNSDGQTLAVVYADGHTVTLPIAEVRRLVQAQTGKTIEQLAANPAPTTP